MHIRATGVTLTFLLFAALLCAQDPEPGKNAPAVRGKTQDVYFFPGAQAARPETKPIVLYASGDGGWRGFAVTMAETMASWGYDTFGLDSKAYLESFTGKTTLKESDVNADLRALMLWARGKRARPVILVGWSEGAGLVLLGAAGPENRDLLQGLITIGLPDRNILAWHWSDAVTWLTKKDPDEPGFVSALHLPRVAPLPFVMLNSSQDQFQSQETYQHLFQLAREPKKLFTVTARDHRFDGNREAFFDVLRASLLWTEQVRATPAVTR